MGDRNRKPNFVPLLSLLSILARSCHIPVEDDCDVSDSDSDSDGHCLVAATNEWNPYMTENAQGVSQKFMYKLPARDARTLTSKELIVRILGEKATIPQMWSSKDGMEQDLGTIVAQYVSHICFNSEDVSNCVCKVAGKIIIDKKADEQKLAATALTSMLHVNDQYMKNRVYSALNCIVKGIDINSDFEKEVIFLLETLIIELGSRTGGEGGFEAEVQCHSIMLDKLEELVTLLDQSRSHTVKQKLFTLIKVMLHVPSRDKAPCHELNYQTVPGLILACYTGESLDCYIPVRKEIERKKKTTGEIVPYTDIETVKDKIFDLLTGLYISVNDSIAGKSTSAAKEFVLHQDPIATVCASAAFSEYFMALRHCLTGPEGQRRAMQDPIWILTMADAMLVTFWVIDHDDRISKRCHIDVLKGEMILLFERLVQLDAKQFFDALVEGRISSSLNTSTDPIPSGHGSGDDPVSKMLEVFVTSNDNAAFNNTYTVHFYKLLMALADHSSVFLKTLLKHDNWAWSLTAFVLNQNPADRGYLYQTILDGTKHYVKSHEAFRRKVYKRLVECNSLFLHNRLDNGALELLLAIFGAEGNAERTDNHMDEDASPLFCISSFVSSKTGGMSRLSLALRAVFGKLSGENFCDLDVSDLSLCLKCMLLVLQPLSPREANQVMIGAWPEVDETNFVLTQIVTMTSQEWKLECSNSIAEVVDIARKLQRFLLTTQSAVANKQ